MSFSNAELMLMKLISQSPNKTGYEINKWVRKLGYNKWAGVGKTSVYNGFNKLTAKEYLNAHLNTIKTGKDPLPTCYVITEKGSKAMKQDMLEIIQTTRERDQRFLFIQPPDYPQVYKGWGTNTLQSFDDQEEFEIDERLERKLIKKNRRFL